MMSNLIKVGYMFYWLTMFFIITAESVIIYHHKYARTLPCHNLICSRYISTTTSQRTSHGKKITAGEIAQQRLHLHLDGEKNHNNSKRESSIKRKGWKRQARTQAGTSLHRSHESEGKMIQGEFHAPEVRRKQAFTSTRVFPLEAIQRSSEINHHDVWPHLINKWKGRTTTEKRLRTEAISYYSVAPSLGYYYSFIKCIFSVLF